MKNNITNSSFNKIYNNQRVTTKINKKNNKSNFDSILDKKLNNCEKKQDVIFSKHANLRLEQRNIELTEDKINKISDAVDIAEKKGIKNSLIVTDEIVCIANIKSKTVITVVDNMKDKVFTNVDGVVSI